MCELDIHLFPMTKCHTWILMTILKRYSGDFDLEKDCSAQCRESQGPERPADCSERVRICSHSVARAGSRLIACS